MPIVQEKEQRTTCSKISERESKGAFKHGQIKTLSEPLNNMDNNTCNTHATKATNIPINTFCYHLFGRTKGWKCGPQIVLVEDFYIDIPN